jgi:hypothetical protein
MDAIPYVDELIREYLLFRGYVKCFTVFNLEKSKDLTAVQASPAPASDVAAHSDVRGGRWMSYPLSCSTSCGRLTSTA